jgi:phosphate-selective porin OprO/OprP
MRKTILFLMVTLFCVKGYSQVSYSSAEKGLSIKALDESVTMKLNFRIQSLATLSTFTNGDEPEMNAMIRRMRLKAKGYIYNPKFEYKLELALSNRDMGNSRDEKETSNAPKLVLDAVLKYNINDKNEFWFGQTKLPGNRERVISSRDLQFVDRSNVNSKFNIDRDFGIQYRHNNSIGEMPLILSGAITTGEGRNITAVNEKLGMAYTGRVEFYPFGSFTKGGDYFGSDLKREEKHKLAIGASYCFNQNTHRSGGQLGKFITDSLGKVYTDISTLFVDMMYKYKGVSVMVEYANKQTPQYVSGFATGSGLNSQIGYLFKNNYEISSRYTQVELFSSSTASSITNEYTLGFSKYIVGHMLKWQTDVSYITNEGSSDGEYRFRVQLELGI